MAEEKHHHHILFRDHKNEKKLVHDSDYSDNTYFDKPWGSPKPATGDSETAAYSACSGCDKKVDEIDYKKEENHHKHLEHLGGLGAAAGGAFPLHEKHKAEKDPEYAHWEKIEVTGFSIKAPAAVGSGGFACHERHGKTTVITSPVMIGSIITN